MDTKKIMTYFAVTLVALAVCVQVVSADITVPITHENLTTLRQSISDLQIQINTLDIDQTHLQTQVDNLQTENSNLKTQVNNLQNDNNNLHTQVNTMNRVLSNALSNLQIDVRNLQSQVDILKAKPAGSQVVVMTGKVQNGDSIKVPSGYTTDQCKVLIGLPNNYDLNIYNTQVWNGATYAGIYSNLMPSSDKTSFNVVIHFRTELTNPVYPGPLSYMLVATK